MRILDLDLDRYGTFTSRKIAFRRGARLHVVLGRNEAGKSSSLEALTDLFFGIPARTPFDFQHEAKDLRIGALIETQKGEALQFIRRKGNKNTLLGADGQPLPDHSLHPFLGALKRDVFRRAFGLNSEQLRSGAEELLKSDGDVGASLLAAASGLRGLNELRKDLAGEAEGIFAERRSKDRLFYQALTRHDDARAAIRDRQLRAGDWEALNRSIDELTSELNSIKQRSRDIKIESSRLARLRLVAPLVSRIDADLATLQSLGDLPQTAPGFNPALRGNLEALRLTREDAHRCESAESQASRDLAAIAVDQPLLAQKSAIDRLFSETAAYEKNQRDLPRIQSEAAGFNRDLDELAARLGLSERGLVESSRPADAARSSVRKLVSDAKELDGGLKQAAKAIQNAQDDIEELKVRGLQSGAAIDPGPLQRRFKLLSAELGEIKRSRETASQAAVERMELNERAARLNPPIHDIDSASARSLPSAETIAQFRDELAGLDSQIAQNESLLTGVHRQIDATEIDLYKTVSAGPVPTAAAIAALRRERDSLWTGIRSALFDPIPVLQLVEAIANFEHAVSAADTLADRANTEAQLVTTHASQTRQLQQLRDEESALTGVLTALRSRRSATWQAWIGTWSAAQLVPLTPVQMAAWLVSLQAIFVRREKLRILEAEASTGVATSARIATVLTEIACDAALLPASGDLLTLATHIDKHLESLAGSWQAVRDLETQIQAAQSRLAKSERERSRAESAHRAWHELWLAALPGIGMPPATAPEAAEAVLATWDAVPSILKERDNRASRVTGMQREIDSFEERANRLVLSIAPHLAGLPPADAVRRLNRDLAAASNAEATRSEAAKRLAECQRKRAEADSAVLEAQRSLETLVQDLPPQPDWTVFLDASERRDTLLREISARRQDLVASSEGKTELAIREDLATFDADQASAAIDGLDREASDIEEKRGDIYARLNAKENERKAMEQGTGSEFALQQQRNAEAELSVHARRWSILKIATLMLAEAVEGHRLAQQEPLLTRAAQIFAAITGGAFQGIGQTYNDDDNPILAARRSNGESVPVAGMSDGTRDQLYLALRLASVEDFASKGEPIPFICDDIFTTFDDARTARALEAMSSLGPAVQTILFTHHNHVAEIATQKLGAALDLIEL